MTRYCGRDFFSEELEKIRTLIANNPGFTRSKISREICRMFQWLKPDGKLKDMSCRVAMLRMEKDGLIRLPAPTSVKTPVKQIKFTTATDPQTMIVCTANHLPKLHLQMVTKTTSSLWNEYMERYHYLGYYPLPGAQLRYFIWAGEQIVALSGFGAAAWQTAPRDRFIGWNHDQRKNNLHLIVNNARFLILPWVQSKNLASKILSLTTRHLPDDWESRYNVRPVLMESFVQKDRFAGTCYRAISVPIKDVWVYPMEKKFRDLLKNS